MNKAKRATAQLMKILENPDLLVEATSLRMIKTHRNSAKWSLRNQFLMLIQGAGDAGTYRHWKSVGRKVQDFDQKVWIIAPIKAPALDEDGNKVLRDGKPVMRLVGFRDHYTYGIENTEVVDAELWRAESPDAEDAAKHLGDMTERYESALSRLKLDKVTADGGGSYYYHPSFESRKINLAHIDEQVFVHELVHAVDDHLGSLTKKPGQQPDNELVAEVSAAAVMIASHGEAHPLRKGCMEYIRHYGGDDFIKEISKLTYRIQACVDFIMA